MKLEVEAVAAVPTRLEEGKKRSCPRMVTLNWPWTPRTTSQAPDNPLPGCRRL